MRLLSKNVKSNPEQWEPDETEREFCKKNGLLWSIDENKEKRYIETERIKIAEGKKTQEAILKENKNDLLQHYKNKEVTKFLLRKTISISYQIKFYKYLLDIIFSKNLSEIAIIKAFLEGDSQAVIEAKTRLTEKENQKYKELQNERNVDFEYIVKFPDGTKSRYEGTTYPADFEGLSKAFQLNPDQNEQFKIKMEIEITNTRRSKNDYQDLIQHFWSRPPLRMSPMPDVVQVIEGKIQNIKNDNDEQHKETRRIIDKGNKKTQERLKSIENTTHDTKEKLSSVVDEKYKGIKVQAKALRIGETVMKELRRDNPELKNKNGATLIQLQEALSKHEP